MDVIFEEGKRNICICFIYGEVFLDSRGFTVKLARYTVEGFTKEKEALVNAVIFVCNVSTSRGLGG